jgi:predicted permease
LTVARARPLLRALMGAVVLVLLIAAANLASLLLVRAVRRRREFGVRLALGADRSTLLRQLLTESLLLSLTGGLFGLVLAAGLLRLGLGALPESLPRIAEVGVHWPVLLLALCVMVTTGIVCGLAPATVSWRVDVVHAMTSGPQASASRAHLRLRGFLVATEACLAMLLLVGAALLLRSYARMLETAPGFDPEHVITAEVALPAKAYSTQPRIDAFFRQLEDRLRTLPGVRAVGFSSNLPAIGQNSGRMFTPVGYVTAPGAEWRIASNYLVAGDYFAAMHIPLIAGRYFRPADDLPDAPLAVIVSQSVARRYFPGQNPIGRQLHWGDVGATGLPSITVVGVVGDIKQSAFDQPTQPELYEPLSQLQRSLGPALAQHVPTRGDMRIVVRAAGDPQGIEEGLRRSVRALDPQLALTHVERMDEVVAATEAPRRFNTVLLGAFAAVALFLALLGIYGVLAYSVSERTREIALRVALGAQRTTVIGMVLRSGLALTASGVAAGAVLSLLLVRFLKSLLYGVAPLDPLSFAAASLLLLAAAFAASLLPARYAASIQPMEALREQ